MKMKVFPTKQKRTTTTGTMSKPIHFKSIELRKQL